MTYCQKNWLCTHTALPRFDWIQRFDWITVIFYTKAFCNPLIEAFPPDVKRSIVICLTYEGIIFKNEIIFVDSVNWPCCITNVCETGKIEMIFQKTAGKFWTNYGVLLQQNKTVSDVVNDAKSDFIITDKMQVNHNIFLIKLERSDGGKVVVPIGNYVNIFVNINGKEISRSYSPVPQSLFTGLAVNEPRIGSLCLMIKRYENGNVSKFLTSLGENDVIQVTKPLGDFELIQIEKRETFVLLAAGTGISPMLTLLVFFLQRRIKKCKFIRLLFFNETKKDIPFRNQFENLEMRYSKLKVNHILSDPDKNWTGLRGRVNKEMIDNAIQEHIKDTGYTIRHIFFFICGPRPFVVQTIKDLHHLEVDDNQIHVFQG